jgi:hypothetical protein
VRSIMPDNSIASRRWLVDIGRARSLGAKGNALRSLFNQLSDFVAVARQAIEQGQQKQLGTSFFSLAIDSSIFHMYQCHILHRQLTDVKGRIMGVSLVGTAAGDAEVGEVTLGLRAKPKSDPSTAGAKLEVVHDQGRLTRSLQVESSFRATQDDLNWCPGAGFQVSVGFVLLRLLFAQAKPREVRMGGVLYGMIPPDLIFGATVGWPDINVLIAFAIALNAESDSDEATGRIGSTAGGLASDIELKHAVTQRGVAEDCQETGILGPGRPFGVYLDEFESRLTTVLYYRGLDVQKLKVFGLR